MKETYDLIVQVHIEKKIADQYSGEHISTTVETRGIKASSFLEVCEILGSFHKLVERLKEDAS